MIKKYLATLIFVSFFLLLSLVLKTPVKAESTAGALPHKTDYLNLPVCGTKGCGTTWYPTHTASQRSTYRQQIKSRGYTHIYLSITSPSHDYFDKTNGAAEFKALLQEIVNDGLKPVVFLTSDVGGTTGNWSQQSVSAIKSDLTAFIPQINSLVNSYVLGIEIDEYWKYSTSCAGVTKTAAQCIGEHLDTLTGKPLAAHQLPGKWDLCKGWCDYMVLQTNNPSFSTTTTAVKNMVTNARNALNKPVVAGEYHKGSESVGISLGNAALEACAAGFGNGGTPSKIIWPNCTSGGASPTPTKSRP